MLAMPALIPLPTSFPVWLVVLVELDDMFGPTQIWYHRILGYVGEWTDGCSRETTDCVHDEDA